MNNPGALRSYVEKRDDTYCWNFEAEDKFFGSKVYNISLHSQMWKDLLWKHRLRLILPKDVEHRYVMLMISGSGLGFEELIFCKALSDDLKIPCAVLHDIPNQPLFEGLYEDALVSFTFSKFIKTGDEEWPLLLPMVKAAARSMDCLEEFLENREDKPEGFIVTGASKRGWTTWLVSAVDERVKAIAPMVFDNLNFAEQMKHQIECYGTYSEQISDYVNLRPVELLMSEVGQRLAGIVDPYSYMEDITVPKLIVNGTNDRYWTVDSLNIYYDGLEGEKYLLYVPNSGHGLEDRRRVINTISAFTRSVMIGSKLPELTSEPGEDGRTLRVSSTVRPLYVDLWIANSEDMDFRDSSWTSIPALEERDYYAFLPGGERYLAAYAEASFAAEGRAFSLSTKMTVLKPRSMGF